MDSNISDYEKDLKIKGNAALEYMEEKYQTKFYPLSYDLSDYLSGIDIVECYADGMDSEHERTCVYIRQEDGEIIFQDDYFGYSVRNEMESYISDMLRDSLGQCKVFREKITSVIPDELTSEHTMNDFYEFNPQYRMSVKIYVNEEENTFEENYKKKIEQFERRLLESGHRFTIYLFVVSSDDYSAIDRYSQDDIWNLYMKNDKADGQHILYAYHATISKGEVKKDG